MNAPSDAIPLSLPSVEELQFDTLHNLIVAFYSLDNDSNRKILDQYLVQWQSCSQAWALIQAGVFSEITDQCEPEVKMFLATALKNKVIFDFREVPKENYVVLIASIIKRARQALVVERSLPLAEQLGVVLAHICIHLSGDEWSNPLETLEEKILGVQESQSMITEGHGGEVSRIDNTTLYLVFLKVLIQESFHTRSSIVQRFKRREHQDYLNYNSHKLLSILDKTVEGGVFSDASEDFIILALDCINEFLVYCEIVEPTVPAIVHNRICNQCFEWAASTSSDTLREKSMNLLSSVMYHISDWCLRDPSSLPHLQEFLLNAIDKVSDDSLYHLCLKAMDEDDWTFVAPYIIMVKYLLLVFAPSLAELFWPSGPVVDDNSILQILRPRSHLFKRLFGLMQRAVKVDFDPDDRALGSNGVATEGYRFWWKLTVEFLRLTPHFALESSPVAHTGAMLPTHNSNFRSNDNLYSGQSTLSEFLLPVLQSIPQQLKQLHIRYPYASIEISDGVIVNLLSVPSYEIGVIVTANMPNVDTTELTREFDDLWVLIGKLCNRIQESMLPSTFMTTSTNDELPDLVDVAGSFWQLWSDQIPTSIETQDQCTSAISGVILLHSTLQHMSRHHARIQKKTLFRILSQLLDIIPTWFGSIRNVHTEQLRIVLSYHISELMSAFVRNREIGRGIVIDGYNTDDSVHLWMKMANLAFNQLLVASDLLMDHTVSSTSPMTYMLAVKLSQSTSKCLAEIIKRPPRSTMMRQDSTLTLVQSIIIDVTQGITSSYHVIPPQSLQTIVEAIVHAASFFTNDENYYAFVTQTLFEPLYNELVTYVELVGPALTSVILSPDYTTDQVVQPLNPNLPFANASGPLLGIIYRLDVITLLICAFTHTSHTRHQAEYAYGTEISDELLDLKHRKVEVREAIFTYIVKDRMWQRAVEILKVSRMMEELAEKAVRCFKYIIRMPCNNQTPELLLQGCDILQTLCNGQDSILSCHLYMGQLFSIDVYKKRDIIGTNDVIVGIKALFNTMGQKGLGQIGRLAHCIPRYSNDTDATCSEELRCILEDYYSLLESFMSACPIPCGASASFGPSLQLLLQCRWIEHEKVVNALYKYLVSVIKVHHTWRDDLLTEWPDQNDVVIFTNNIKAHVLAELPKILSSLMEVVLHYPPAHVLDSIIKVIDTSRSVIGADETAAIMWKILNDRNVTPDGVFATEVEQGYFLDAIRDIGVENEEYDSYSDDYIHKTGALNDAIYDIARISCAVRKRQRTQ